MQVLSRGKKKTKRNFSRVSNFKTKKPKNRLIKLQK